MERVKALVTTLIEAGLAAGFLGLGLLGVALIGMALFLEAALLERVVVAVLGVGGLLLASGYVHATGSANTG